MSYCRWSSDDFMCDLYCYADVSGGWTTHVAARRRARKPEVASPYTLEAMMLAQRDPEAWSALYTAYHRELAAIHADPIGLPHDGESFNDATLEDFRARVVMLRDAGYNVPAYVIDEIDAEIADPIHPETGED